MGIPTNVKQDSIKDGKKKGKNEEKKERIIIWDTTDLGGHFDMYIVTVWCIFVWQFDIVTLKKHAGFPTTFWKKMNPY